MKTIDHIKITDLKPYQNNARTHSEKQVEKIADSIKKFGFVNPVLIDADKGIIAGHCRVAGAIKLGMTEVPCLSITHLTEEEKRAYILADNRLALDAGWDESMLRVELGELASIGFDLSVIGFDEFELEKNIKEVNFLAGTAEDQGRLDQLEPKMVNCPHCKKDFDSRGREV